MSYKQVLGMVSLVTLLLWYKQEYVYHPTYEVYEDRYPLIGRYRKGYIYVGTKEEIAKMGYLQGENDVYILDERDKIMDPNLKIYDSYEIYHKEERNDILEVLCNYEKSHPSEWKRSIESMRVEWSLHNLAHFFHYKLNRTTDVDFNNEDEELYDQNLLRKLVK